MNATETATAAVSPMAGKITASTAVAEITWGITLMKVPTEDRTETAIPTFGPYSLPMMLTKVLHPVRRKGLA